MKEKLIELLLTAEKVADEAGFFNCHKSQPKAELIADYLIQNGVIVPPCKVGDTVYRITTSPHTKIKKIQETKIIRIAIDDEGVFLFCQRCPAKSVFGKNVFLTKEEAEKKLKEYENK